MAENSRYYSEEVFNLIKLTKTIVAKRTKKLEKSTFYDDDRCSTIASAGGKRNDLAEDDEYRNQIEAFRKQTEEDLKQQEKVKEDLRQKQVQQDEERRIIELKKQSTLKRKNMITRFVDLIIERENLKYHTPKCEYDHIQNQILEIIKLLNFSKNSKTYHNSYVSINYQNINDVKILYEANQKGLEL
jgi:hypothetical protein